MKKKDGITLIALIITIIVLLILAGVSITMITSQDGIITKAVDSKSSMEKAKIQEALDLATMEFLDDDNMLLENIAEILEKQGYNIKKISDSMPNVSKIELSASTLSLNENESAVLKVNVEESANQTKYYAVIEGKYYEITENNGKINLSKDETKIDSGVDASALSIEVTGANNTTVTIDQEKKEITVTGKSLGKDTLTIKCGGKKATCEVEVIKIEGLLNGEYLLNENVDINDAKYKNETVIYTYNMPYSIKSIEIEYVAHRFSGSAGEYDENGTAKNDEWISAGRDDAYFDNAQFKISKDGKIYIRRTNDFASIGFDANIKIILENGMEIEDSFKVLYGVSCLPAGTMIEVEEEEEDENGKKKKRRRKKKIEDLTYDDNIVVWNFDEGKFDVAKSLWLMKKHETTEYNLLKFSDGSELKTIDQHRIFNKELGKFTYPMTDETPIGTTTFNVEGKEVKLVSKEKVSQMVEFYNLISYFHMNAFANGILTSCRFNNLYNIENMKFVKEEREKVSREEYRDIPDEYFYGLRLDMQPKEVNRGNDVNHGETIKEYVQRIIKIAKEK